MQRSTFRTSPIDRERRRTAGPALTLVDGTSGSVTTTRAIPSWHPASEEFAPDGPSAAAARLRPVRDSEPGTPSLRSTSRGSASPDSEGTASPGSGPITREVLLEYLAVVLEATAGDPPATRRDDRVLQAR